MTHTIAVCTVKNSWWWTEELSETCRVLFQKWIWEITASSWFYYKKVQWSSSHPRSHPVHWPAMSLVMQHWHCLCQTGPTRDRRTNL